jgi:hypothetical protein
MPTVPRDTVFGKVMTRCQVMRKIIALKESIQPTARPNIIGLN